MEPESRLTSDRRTPYCGDCAVLPEGEKCPAHKGSWVTPQKFAEQVILNVCELPDHTSPDDQPDLLQCTIRELEDCVIRAFEHFGNSGEVKP